MPTADADACAASVCGNRVSCSGNAGIDACEYGNAPMERNAVGNSGGGEIERGVLPGGGREDFTDGRYCRARLRRRPLSA